MAGDLEERLRRMDGILRPIAALGRPSGCGMPGTVSAKPLSRLLQQVVLHLPAGTTNWQFVDIGAGSGRMLYAASICGASACCGVELCNLTHVFEAGLSRLVQREVLQSKQAGSCKLVIGDAKRKFKSTSHLLAAAAVLTQGPVVVSLIDEGMPLSVREHAYRRLAADKQVAVIVCVNYKSRHAHLQENLSKGGFVLVQELPAPLAGGCCHTTGRVYARRVS